MYNLIYKRNHLYRHIVNLVSAMLAGGIIIVVLLLLDGLFDGIRDFMLENYLKITMYAVPIFFVAGIILGHISSYHFYHNMDSLKELYAPIRKGFFMWIRVLRSDTKTVKRSAFIPSLIWKMLSQSILYIALGATMALLAKYTIDNNILTEIMVEDKIFTAIGFGPTFAFVGTVNLMMDIEYISCVNNRTCRNCKYVANEYYVGDRDVDTTYTIKNGGYYDKQEFLGVVGPMDQPANAYVKYKKYKGDVVTSSDRVTDNMYAVCNHCGRSFTFTRRFNR